MPAPDATSFRCAAWNVNGVRALLRKGQDPWKLFAGSDVLFLQETKAAPSQLTAEQAEPAGWHAHWLPAERPGYSGVAAFSRRPPDAVERGVGAAPFDDEGRVLTLRFGELVVVGAYFPNAQEGGKRLQEKLAFCEAMERLLRRWRRRGCATVLLGDYNIAHRPIDLARPKQNEGNPGYLPEERAWFTRYLRLGYRDVFRERVGEESGHYTWWSYRARARPRNVGWRLDYATVSPGLADRVREAAHHPEIGGSDHCPVSVAVS